MATGKLYYVNQYLTEETACVISCAPAKGGFAVILDRTIFYPTGEVSPAISARSEMRMFLMFPSTTVKSSICAMQP